MRKNAPTAYIDEHVGTEILETIRGAGFVCRTIARSKYSGKDERNYIGELRSVGAIFVTADDEFVKELVLRGTSHGGIIWVPQNRQFGPDLKALYLNLASAMVWGARKYGTRIFRNEINYVADDGGYYNLEKQGSVLKSRLWLSYDRHVQIIEELS